MKCPHCLENFHYELCRTDVRSINKGSSSPQVLWDEDGRWFVDGAKCPACDRAIVHLFAEKRVGTVLVHPKAVARAALPKDVPPAFAEDYAEAALVLPSSAKASAALSRRCLQRLLEQEGKATQSNLSAQINYVIASGTLPSDLAADLDSIRVVGNFAAHPIKDRNSGAIVEVEPGEAEWNLDVLEELLDFYFARPALRKARREALNKKLVAAGKPELKSS